MIGYHSLLSGSESTYLASRRNRLGMSSLDLSIIEVGTIAEFEQKPKVIALVI